MGRDIAVIGGKGKKVKKGKGKSGINTVCFSFPFFPLPRFPF
jgi:hypothetical protein